jgi:hypothetical protein
MGFVWFPLFTPIISLNSVKKSIFVMVKCGVLFEVRTEYLFRWAVASKGVLKQ